MTSTITTEKPAVNGTKVTRPRAPRRPAAIDKPAKTPTHLEVPPATLEDSAKAKAAGEAIQVFANAIAAVEVLAYEGHHELITQIARIAYTRGRQVARDHGVDL